MDERIEFSRSFAKRMLILALCVGLLVGLSLPVTYYYLSSEERERNNALRAILMADTVAEAIRDNEELWFYDVPRFIEVSQKLPMQENVTAIRILDENRQLLYENILRNDHGVSIATEVPIVFNHKLRGYLSIEETKFDLVRSGIIVLSVFVLLGGSLALVIYQLPVRMAREAEIVVSCVVDELQASRDTMKEMAIRDGKTHLYNATHLMSLLEEAVETARTKREPLHIAMLDLDYFKKYNDINGHLSGDAVLTEISDILRHCIRTSDIAGRFGGEEFLIVLPQTDREDAEAIAERLHTAIAKHVFFGEDVLPTGSLTVSIGLAGLEIGMSCSEMVHAADMAMYMSKESGRNQISVYAGGEYFIDGKKMIRFCDLSFQNNSFKELMGFLDRPDADKPFTSQISTLISYLKTLDSRESDTAQHSFLVNRIAMSIGRKMGLQENELLQLNWGTLLHDIGKLGIGDAIILKREGLNNAEYECIKHHPQVGYDLVKDNEYLTSASRIVLCHHEKWDGSGYPNGLQGNQIHLLARICSLADTVAAMAVDRPYRQAIRLDEIVNELQRCAGKQFDRNIVELFMAIPDKQELLFGQN